MGIACTEPALDPSAKSQSCTESRKIQGKSSAKLREARARRLFSISAVRAPYSIVSAAGSRERLGLRGVFAFRLRVAASTGS